METTRLRFAIIFRRFGAIGSAPSRLFAGRNLLSSPSVFRAKLGIAAGPESRAMLLPFALGFGRGAAAPKKLALKGALWRGCGQSRWGPERCAFVVRA